MIPTTASAFTIGDATPDTTPTFQRALTANDLSAELIRFVRAGDTDMATQTIELIIRELAVIVEDYKLDLTEVLPHVKCDECGRNAVDCRRTSGGRLCIACLDERLSVLASAPPIDIDRREVLERATEAVTLRGDCHGAPAESFARIAAMWSVIFRHEVRAHEIALCLVALKLVRATASPTHADNWVDMAGYAACGAEAAKGKAA